MIWIVLATLFFTAALMLISGATRSSNTNLVTAIVNGISAIVPIALVLAIASKKPLESNKTGIILAVIAGMLIAGYGLTLTKSFSVNKVGVVTPLIYGGSILLTTILSYFIFKEKISVLQGVGLALLLAGFVVITYARATGK